MVKIYDINAKIYSILSFCLVIFVFLSPFSANIARFGNFKENILVKNTNKIQEVFAYLPKCDGDNTSKTCKIDKGNFLLLKSIYIISIDKNGYWVEIKTENNIDNAFLIHSNLIHSTSFQAIKDDK